MNNRLVTFTAGLISVWIIGYLLIIGRNLLVPFVIAVFIWYLLNMVKEGIQRVPFLGSRLPNWLIMLVALAIVAILAEILINIITNTVNEIIDVLPRYQENLTKFINTVEKRFDVKALVSVDQFFKQLNFQGILVNTYAVFSTITSSALLIILYVGFLFLEQHYFRRKLKALFPHKEHRELVHNITTHIVNDTQIYLGLKAITSFISAVASWIIMRFVGLDFAEFWGLLIFLLNFIPNIGAIVATVFPALLALLQFENWWPFIIITSSIIAIQFIIGNLVEPRFLGKSLNLSPIVILFSLALWGAGWGIIGMFLSVPITVMMMIIFAHFKTTRPLAILLSQDGQTSRAYETV